MADPAPASLPASASHAPSVIGGAGGSYLVAKSALFIYAVLGALFTAAITRTAPNMPTMDFDTAMAFSALALWWGAARAAKRGLPPLPFNGNGGGGAPSPADKAAP